VGLAGLAAAGASSVVTAFGDAQGRVNGGSIWAGPRRWLAEGGSSPAGGRALSWVAVAAAVGLTVALVRRRGGDDGPFYAAGAAVVAYLLVGTYVLPWYLAWGLPVLAVVWRWRVGWLVMAQAAILQLATARAPTTGAPDALATGSAVGRLQLDLYTVGAPMLELALIVVLIVALVRSSTAASPTSVEAARAG
jgi:hypothetical protein